MFLQKYLSCGQVIGSIDANGLNIGHSDLDTITGREPAELLKALGLLEGRLG
jgi:hypothetical protein